MPSTDLSPGLSLALQKYALAACWECGKHVLSEKYGCREGYCSAVGGQGHQGCVPGRRRGCLGEQDCPGAAHVPPPMCIHAPQRAAVGGSFQLYLCSELPAELSLLSGASNEVLYHIAT